jgi:hypothetical protein
MNRRGSRKKTSGLNTGDDSLRAAIRRANAATAPDNPPARPETTPAKKATTK